MKMKSTRGAAALTALALATAAGHASPFGAGTLIVVRVGDGAAALTSSAAAVFIEERSPVDGSLIQAIALPIAASGASGACTASGSATTEGFMALAANNQFLLYGGYNAVPGTASITTSTTISRVVARIDLSGNVDTTTQLLAAGGDGNTGNIRSVTSDNGTNIWVGTSAGGTRYTTFGTNAASTQVCANPLNMRVVHVFSGQLYGSSGSGTFVNVFTIGAGLPTTTGQTATSLAGFPTATRSPEAYFFADANTLYVADDGAIASNGGVQKWTLSGGTWSNAYTFALGTSGARGLTGKVSGGVPTVWATSSAAGAPIWTITDTGATSTPVNLVSAATNTAFRGLKVLPGTFGGAVEGACCLPNGACILTSSAGCTTQSGTYGGNFSDCSQVTCIQPGACCLADGSCQVLSSAQCTTAGGTYNGNGSTCGAVTCPQPGSCCLPDGTCQVMSSGQCSGAGGTFGGGSTTCATAVCGARSGACCAGNGTCSVTTAAACGSGTYRGDGTTCSTVSCGAFGAGNLVVYEVSSTTPNVASSVSIKEIRISDGAVIQSVGLPAVQNEQGNRALTLNGGSTTEGGMNRSTDGHYLVLMGYNLTGGTLNPSSSTASRVAGRVDSSGRADTTTGFTDGTFSSSSPRGAASVDGSAFWLCGDSNVLANRGIHYAVVGANSSTQLNDTGPTNSRAIGIFNGNVYFSNTTGTAPASTGHINQLGTGLPTTSGQTVSELSLIGVPALNNAQGFFFSDATTLYAGGNSASTVNGIIKYSFDGQDWVQAYVLDAGGTFTLPIQQLTGTSSGGVVTLYGTTGEGPNGGATSNKLYSVTDTGSGSAYTLIASAPGTAVWKGVALAPVPTAAPCYANCDSSTQVPFLNVADFTCFLQKFAGGDAYANCDGSTQPPVLNVADFTCFLQKFAAGCSAP